MQKVGMSAGVVTFIVLISRNGFASLPFYFSQFPSWDADNKLKLKEWQRGLYRTLVRLKFLNNTLLTCRKLQRKDVWTF